jgi:glycosyltransferase involved in cell wall biosynthesis
MGIAQDMGFVLGLVERLETRQDVGFVFVGRGSEVTSLRERVARMGLSNAEFYDEVDPALVPNLLRNCDIGIVALDSRHTTHNIPGKFLTYIQAGLPVLARINAGNDLEELIDRERLGSVYTGSSPEEFERVAVSLLRKRQEFAEMGRRGMDLSRRVFSVEAAANQLLEAFQPRAVP